MGRKSKVELLHPQLRQAVDELVRGGATIERIVEHLHTLAPGVDPAADLPSESAVGRYKQKAEASMRRFREAQSVAKVWVDKFGAEPQGDVGLMVTQLLGAVAFRTVADLDGAPEPIDPQSLMFLAKAMKDMAGAETSAVQRERVRIAARRELAAEVARKAATEADAARAEAKSKGLSDEQADWIRARILGVQVEVPAGA